MKVSIIGAGKAAWFLAERLRRSNIAVYQVYNRTATRGQILCDAYGAEYVPDIQKLDTDIDALFFAINDSLIDDLAEVLVWSTSTLLISLSGSRDISTLPSPEHWSVMWPIYSLMAGSAEKDDIPLVLDTPAEPSLVELTHTLADALSKNQYILNQEKRLMAHLSAVFANNFVNFINKEMFLIMKHAELDTDMMQDIMKSTLGYSLEHKQDSVLTGPAVRHDEDTIQHHIESLAYDPTLQKLYQNITQSIIDKTEK